mmetsp:Transcript_10722/g.23245  ORF Transcript_10722/g.23245 Transcript_10722/m.23245 type:complete len:400 (-) Transcript_10722:245-1444(-)
MPVRLRVPSSVALIAMQMIVQCLTRAPHFACSTLCTSTGIPPKFGAAAFIRTACSTSRTSRRDPTACSESAVTGRALISVKGDRHEILTSTKSSTVKLFKSLASKKRKRMNENATIIEGQRLVFDVLSDPSTQDLVRHVILEESALHDEAILAVLQDLASNSSASVSFATKEVVRACSDTVTPQGVVAIASLPPPYDAHRRYGNGGEDKKTSDLYLVLDGMSDPGNVGTLFRSALACGVEAVVLMPGSCDVFSPKTVRSSMGATFKMPLLHVDGWDHCKKVLTGFGVKLDSDFYAATMEGSEVNDEFDACSVSSSYYDVDWTGRGSSGGRSQTKTDMAVCIGKEGPGLSEEVREAVRNGEIRAVHVPMEQAIESLNAAVCGSVILFEAARQIKTEYQGI